MKSWRTLFILFYKNYKKDFGKKGSKFVFDSVNLLYYKLYKISLNRGASYVDTPKQLKNKKANPKNNDEKCFQYAITVALNHEQIKSHPERTLKIKPFIDQYIWKEIYFPLRLKQFETNNKLIALNVLFVPYSSKQIRATYFQNIIQRAKIK